MDKEYTHQFYLHKMMGYFSVNEGFQPILNIVVLKL